MWALLFQGLRWLGTASIGYFANDIGDAFTNYFPSTTDPKTGRIAWYWIVAIMLVLAIAIIWILNLVFPKKYRQI